MTQIKPLQKQFKLGTPVWYIDKDIIHSDVIVAQHTFSYAVDDSSINIGEQINIGDSSCIIVENLLVVLAYSHRIYVLNKIYVPVSIKEDHKLRSIEKLYLSKESLLESIQKDVINNSNSLTQSTV